MLHVATVGSKLELISRIRMIHSLLSEDPDIDFLKRHDIYQSIVQTQLWIAVRSWDGTGVCVAQAKLSTHRFPLGGYQDLRNNCDAIPADIGRVARELASPVYLAKNHLVWQEIDRVTALLGTHARADAEAIQIIE
ncbi:hypothetical protein [Komagataeibacter rhaeticus]|uniref:hypothetical protein n=1 Tax=Komagataeibacter rhaeticus TaxID=215221 RepID=UPI002493C48C|nr:hypothetical protein [Komagataeibacter rhaeticus]